MKILDLMQDRKETGRDCVVPSTTFQDFIKSLLTLSADRVQEKSLLKFRSHGTPDLKNYSS